MTYAQLPDTASSRGEEKKQRDDTSSGTLLHPAVTEKSSGKPKGNAPERDIRHKKRREARKVNDSNATSTIPVSSSSTKNQKLRLAPGVAHDSHGAVRVGASDDGVTDGDNDVESNLIAAEVAPDVDDLIETEVQKRVRAITEGQENRQDQEQKTNAPVAVVVESNNNKRLWIVLAFLALAVAATITVVFLTQSHASNEASVGNDKSVSTDSPTPDKTSSPTTTPIPVSRYDPPKVTECEKMRKGLRRADADGYQGFFEMGVVVEFHAELSADTSTTLSTSLLTDFKQQIQRVLRPELVGCTTAFSKDTLDYLIFDLDVSVAQDTNSSCVISNDDQSTNTQPCHIVDASMNLWLQGDEKDFQIQSFMLRALEGLDLPVTLELEGQFRAIEVQTVVVDPTVVRVNKVTTILADYSPLDEQTFAWLTEIDTWEPDKEDPNHDYLWLERYVMALLYDSLDGPSWKNSNNWKTSEPVCKWYFVSGSTCPGPVINLDLRGNNLKGSLPSVIGNLSLLTTLNMETNQLTSSIPPSIGNLSKLLGLLLSYNKLTSSIPSSIGDLSQLMHLSFYDNNLSSGIPSSIGNLSRLTWLSLSLNELTSIPSSIGNLDQLWFLNIGRNELTSSIPSTIGNMSRLAWLSLASNGLTGGIPSSIGSLSRLTMLSLRDNKLTGSIPSLPGSIATSTATCNLENNCFQNLGNGETAGCDLTSNCANA